MRSIFFCIILFGIICKCECFLAENVYGSPIKWKNIYMKTVTIYSTSYCPYCDRAKSLLSQKGITYQEVDVADVSAREKMMLRAGGRKTVPQIFIGDTHVGGFDDLNALNTANKLDALLQGE